MNSDNSHSCLTHLIIIHRHANKELLDINSNDADIKLLPIGHKKSMQFGIDIKLAYALNNEFMSDAIFLTSPKIRCRETINGIINGLGLSDPIIHESDKLTFGLSGENALEKACTDENIILLFDKYDDITRKVESILPINHPGTDTIDGPVGKLLILFQLCDYYDLLQCYQDVKKNKYYDGQFKIDLDAAVKKIRNVLSHYYQLTYHNVFAELIDHVISLPNKLIICSTHDSVLFPLVKYLSYSSNQNNDNNDLELPNYLSNIRIEEWSDGMIKIYYDNLLLSSA
jgi:phosphohistidine phosphatase SixA